MKFPLGENLSNFVSPMQGPHQKVSNGCFFQQPQFLRKQVTLCKEDPSQQLSIQLVYVQFCSKQKSGLWFLSTKFQIPLTFTCAFPRTSTFLVFQKKTATWAGDRISAANTESRHGFFNFQAQILFVFSNFIFKNQRN